MCIGKQVAFNVISCVTAINRTHGDVDLINTGNGVITSLALNVVSAGYATVKTSRDDKRSSVYDDLIDAENNAKEEKLGMFGNPSTAIKRVLNWSPTSAEVEVIFKTLKNKPTRVIIEGVRDGAALRVLLLPNSQFPFTYIPFSLAGVLTPRLNNQKNDSSGEPLQGEPYAVQSRHFTEIRLLNRDVDIVMQGLDRMGNILGTVLHPKGNVAIEILKEGLARIADRSLSFVAGPTALEMRKAEASAKNLRKFIWEGYSPFAPSIEAGARMFDGVCVEIVSCDTIVIGHPENPSNPETRVTLSSIRSYRENRDQKDAPRTPTEEAWAYAAKQSLINKILGRKVSVYIEYEKLQGKANTSNRSYGTVIYARGPQGENGKNAAMQLIAEGLVTCVRHKSDEERSVHYDQLLLVEAEAVAAGKGMHGNLVPPAVPEYKHDLAKDTKKTKGDVFRILQKDKTYQAYVEFIYSGSRMKLLLPAEKCILQLALGQIRCPLVAKAAAQGQAARVAEPFADEAQQYTRWSLMQRRVSVTIDDVDKNGIVLGRLYTYNQTTSSFSTPFALSLVEKGLAKVDKYYIDNPLSSQAELELLLLAQNKCKETKTGLWTLPQPDDDDNKDKDDKDSPLIDIKVSEIVDSTFFYIQENENESKLQQVTTMMATFASSYKAPKDPLKLVKGMLCAAMFDDGSGIQWFRARIDDVRNDKSGQHAIVFFIDYGNKDKVPATSISEVPNTYFKIPPLAKPCTLAFVKGPIARFDAYRQTASRFFADLVWDKDISMKVLWTDKNRNSMLHVALYEKNEAEKYNNKDNGNSDDNTDDIMTINEKIVKEGIVRVSKKFITFVQRQRWGQTAYARQLLNATMKRQQEAISEHRNMYEYGDPGSDSDASSVSTKGSRY